MKIKGISFWEQHLERFVIGTAALIFIALAAMQFIGEPNAAQVGGRTIAPGEVDQILIEQAQMLSDRLQQSGNADAPLPTEVLPKLQEKLGKPVSPAPEMLVFHHAVSPVGSELAPLADKPFRVAEVPPPTNLVSRQYTDTISAETVTQHAALAELLPAAPHDLDFVTVAGRWARNEVLAAYQQPGPNGELALPLRWHNDRVDPIDLVLEREEFVDGKWTNLLVVNHIPGQLSFRDQHSRPIDIAARNEILGRAAADPLSITQPEFYEGKAGAWSPPVGQKAQLGQAATEEELAILSLQETLVELEREAERLKKSIQENNCPESSTPAPPPEKPKKGGGGGGVAPPGGGGGDLAGGGGGMRGGPDERDKPGNKARCDTLRRKLKVKEEQISKAKAELEKLQAVPLDEPQPEAVEQPKDVIDVWAHDITVKPGHTYRYRLTMHVYNPMFARKLDLIEEQQPLAEQFTLVSKPSEWSQPIYIEPPLRVFIASAISSKSVMAGMSGALGMGQATFEVYRFHDGRWWLDQFTLQPGDRLGAASKPARSDQTVDFSTDWFLLDIVEVLGSERQDDQRVILHSLAGAAIQERDPKADQRNPERLRLRDRVKLAAEADETVASAG